MRVHFTAAAWADYRHWARVDRAGLERLDALIAAARREPFAGLGQPTPLRVPLGGWWSRRITREHRLVYRVRDAGAAAASERRLEIAQCRYHY